MSGNDVELLSEGMESLIDALGIVEAERFISLVTRERFDYTEWQKEAFADMSLEDIRREALENAKASRRVEIPSVPLPVDEGDYEEEATIREERFYFTAAA